jgi:hypothetical protein
MSFDSLNAAVKFAANNYDKSYGHSINTPANEWTDNYGFHEFVDHFYSFKNKNKKDDKIQKIISILLKHIDYYKHHFTPQNIFTEINDVSGDVVDIVKYIENSPECMLNFDDIATKKAINIVFQSGASGGSSEIIEMIGEMVYALNLILSNRTVNIYGVINNSDELYVLCPIVQASSVVIRPQIELTLLNLKAFFRRIQFAHFEGAHPSIRAKIGIPDSYGRESSVTNENITNYFKIKPDILLNSSYFSRHKNNNIEDICAKLVRDIVELSTNNKDCL